MSKWQVSELGEVADLVLGKMLDQAKNKGALLPYLANVSVRWGEFDLGGLREMRFEPHEMTRYSLRYGDIVMCEGGEPGRCAIWKGREAGQMFQKALHRIRPHDCLDNNYLYYAFLNLRKSDGFAAYFTGATIKHLPREQLAKVEVRFPEIATQKAVAAILSAYDDLIANNQRRITLLERMAEDIYREWFVRLRFPGHEQAKMEKGLPIGWCVKKIGQIFKTSSGGTPSRAEPENFGGSIPWIKTGELKSTFALGSEETITPRAIENSAAKIYKKNTVVMAMYCAMPDISIISNDAATNQACCAFIPHNSAFHHSYCFFLIKFAQLQLVMFAHGAAQQNLSQDIIKKFHVLLPSENLILDFGKKAAPLFESIELLMRTNLQLQATRDALLPRLISGKLAVDTLDIRFPPSFENTVTPK